MPSTEQDQWVTRVLGARLNKTPGVVPNGGDPMALWRDAKDAVDTRLNALAAKLRSFEDEDFDQIADKGLFGLTGGGQTVALTKALMTYNGATGPGKAKAAADLRKSLDGYRAFLDGSELVELIDANPFGVQVMMFATLDHALGQLEAILT